MAVESLARKFGTPLYIYSQATIEHHFRALNSAMSGVDRLICFSVKSNSNQSVLRLLARMGSGFDIVSGGELQRVIDAGGDPRRCIFAGVGKSESEIEFGLRRGVYCFNAESETELARIDRIAARLGRIAPVAVRVNPNVAAGTHAKITTGTYENKFGIACETIEAVYARASRLRHLRLRGSRMRSRFADHRGRAVCPGRPQSVAAAAAPPRRGSSPAARSPRCPAARGARGGGSRRRPGPSSPPPGGRASPEGGSPPSGRGPPPGEG